MNNSKSSQTPKQQSFIDPPVVVDLAKLFAQAGLSENQQGIVKRRLLENRDLFEKVLQLLLQQADQLNQTIDLGASFNQLEKDEMFKNSTLLTDETFNKSTLLTLMRVRLDLRQDDVQLGRTEGISDSQASMKTLLKQMAEEGKLAPEQLEEVFTRMVGLNRQIKGED